MSWSTENPLSTNKQHSEINDCLERKYEGRLLTTAGSNTVAY